jgi:hypothetical protein
VERKGFSATAAPKLECIAISTNTTKFYLRSVFEVLRRLAPADPARCRYFHIAVASERSWMGVFLTGELMDLVLKLVIKTFLQV